MAAAGRLLSGTAERCSRLLAHAARASAASNSAHGQKTVCGEKKTCAKKTKPRLSQASKIDPAQYAQPVGGVPLFFAVKRKKGGALCCYGGHWKTKSFDMCGAGALETGCGRPTFKDRRRQAIIRFAFDHFDAALGAAMNSIPDPPKNRPTTRQKPPRRTRGHPNP
jgi:hypothetical protein